MLIVRIERESVRELEERWVTHVVAVRMRDDPDQCEGVVVDKPALPVRRRVIDAHSSQHGHNDA